MKAVVIAIAGGTASGKTTVAKKVYEATKNKGSVALIKTDDYYKYNPEKDIEIRAKKNYDHPDAIDFDLLVSHIKALKNGEMIEKPTYDFTTHQRKEETERTSLQVTILKV